MQSLLSWLADQEENGLQTHDKLPTMMELAATLGHTKGAMAQTLRLCEIDGLVDLLENRYFFREAPPGWRSPEQTLQAMLRFLSFNEVLVGTRWKNNKQLRESFGITPVQYLHRINKPLLATGVLERDDNNLLVLAPGYAECAEAALQEFTVKKPDHTRFLERLLEEFEAADGRSGERIIADWKQDFVEREKRYGWQLSLFTLQRFELAQNPTGRKWIGVNAPSALLAKRALDCRNWATRHFRLIDEDVERISAFVTSK
jgi:hypothetical protein